MRRVNVMETVTRWGLAVFGVVVGIVVATTGSTSAQTSSVVCDGLIIPTGAYAYGDLGDPDRPRCEGTYRKPISDTGIEFLRGLYFGRPRIDRAGAPISVRWSAPSSSRVYIRAESLDSNRLYRMDTQASGAEFIWPTVVLKEVGPAPENLVLRGWVEGSDDAGTRLMVPLQLSQGENRYCGSLNMRLALSGDVIAMSVTVLNRVSGDSIFGPRRLDLTGMDRSNLPVPLSMIREPGEYTVEIEAERYRKAPFPETFDIYWGADVCTEDPSGRP